MVARALLTGLALLLACGSAAADLIFPNLVQRSGPSAPGGAPFSDGYADYFTLLNERDGGINGIRVQAPECETGNNLERAVECYQGTRGLRPLVYQPLSTAIAARLMPMATADEIPLHAMGYGRGLASAGSLFPWIFNHPATAWDAASVIVNALLQESGGSLQGRSIGFLFLDSAQGREPIRMLQVLSVRHGFRLDLYPVIHPGQEQRAAWTAIGEKRPDYVLLWGWGIMNRVAFEQAAAFRYPMDRMIGAWSSANESDLDTVGRAADGYRTVTFHGTGDRFPLHDDLRRYVVDAGKAASDGSHVGEVLYNQGLFAAVLAAEAARKAMDLHETREITPAMMRDGIESLVLDRRRLTELGLPDFAAALRLDCASHGGSGLVALQRWDASARRWVRATPFLEPDRELVAALTRVDSISYARANGLKPRECPQE